MRTSLAIDPANANTPLLFDQRGPGFSRLFGPVDIGSYELVDTTRPTIASITPIAPVGSATNLSPVLFQVVFSEPVRGFSAAHINVTNGVIVAGTFTQVNPSTYTVKIAPLVDGLVSVSVPDGAAQDYVGNLSFGGSGGIGYDTAPPTATITGVPPVNSNNMNPTFSFTGSDPLVNGYASGINHFDYQIDGGGFITATSPVTLPFALAEGNHTFQVRAVDNAGNVGSPISYAFRIDVTPPTVAITATPPAIAKSATGTFNFTGTDPASNGVSSGINHFQVAIDGGSFTNASSPFTTSALSDGSHTFQVLAVDNAGNVGNPASYTWNIDATPPIATITNGPPAFSNSTSASLTFTGGDPIVNGFSSGLDHLEYQLDGGGFINVPSPASFTNLSDGNHTFQVRAFDKAGNVSSPTSYSWVVDTIPPTVSISNPSVATTIDGPVSFTVSYSDLHFGPITLSAADITLVKTGTANAESVVITGAGATRTVTLQGVYGNGTLGIKIAAGTASDLAGNLAPAAGPSATFQVTGTRTLTISQAAPPTYFLPGSLYRDAISYSTAGTQISHHVYLFMTLPQSATFNALNSSAGWTSVGGGKFRLDLADLNSGSRGTVVFAVTFDPATPAGTPGLFTATISDDLGNGAPVATSKISAPIVNPNRPRWQR